MSTPLPSNYEWLSKEPSPRILLEMLKLYGTVEAPGDADNPVILSWAKELGLDNVYKHDAIAWCGLTIAYAVHKAGLEPVKDPLWALNWNKWGVGQKTAMLGDILVKERNGGGHVCMYVAEDTECFHVLGGNQSDKVCFTRLPKSAILGIRRTDWKIAQPANIRRIFVSATGSIGGSES